jgi:hypothetical protein
MTGQRTAPPALTEPAVETAAVPRFYRVASRREDTADTVTLELTEPAQPVPAFAPGQFAMLTAFGVGEVPISVSGLGDSAGGRARRLEHTLRAVGAVTRALHAAPPGSLIGVRGPFGTGWDVASAAGLAMAGSCCWPARGLPVTCSTATNLNAGAATGWRWRSPSTGPTAAGAVRSGWSRRSSSRPGSRRIIAWRLCAARTS